MRELVHGDRRLKYPMKKVGGQWQRISWDQAIDEIGDKMLEIRERSGADAAYLLGSAKFSNEGAYLFRKFAAFWGTQQRRSPGPHLPLHHGGGCREYLGLRRHDEQLQRAIRNSKTIIFMGSNAAEAPPGVDAAHSHRQGRAARQRDSCSIRASPAPPPTPPISCVFRPGTDIPVIWGINVAYLRERLGGPGIHRPARLGHGPDPRRKSPSGRPMRSSPRTPAFRKPSCAAWRRSSPRNVPPPSSGAWAARKHTVGTANVRAYCNLLLATGNVGAMGTGREHLSVATATCRARPDFGLDIGNLPCYYGLAEGAWRPLVACLGRAVRVFRGPFRCRAGQGRSRSALARAEHERAGHPLHPLVRRHHD